jgi:hypothetical protein
MKNSLSYLKPVALAIITILINCCTKDNDEHSQNNYLKKVKTGGYVVEQYSYNNDNLIEEVRGTMFYRKFNYSNGRLTKEEMAASPDLSSSSSMINRSHDLIDPSKVKISMYLLYEYDMNDRLARKLCYVDESGTFVFRSMITYEYNENNLVSKSLLCDSDSTVTQYFTYRYDSNGNVIEEDYYYYLFIPPGTGPKHSYNKVFEYDTFFNPYAVLIQTGDPGLYTNSNNITRVKFQSFEQVPGLPDSKETINSYKYNNESGYPISLNETEEFIYD